MLKAAFLLPDVMVEIARTKTRKQHSRKDHSYPSLISPKPPTC